MQKKKAFLTDLEKVLKDHNATIYHGHTYGISFELNDLDIESGLNQVDSSDVAHLNLNTKEV